MKFEELQRLAAKSIFVCLCPRSNRGLIGRESSFSQILRSRIRFLIGTDSYRGEYDLLAEARQLFSQFRHTLPRTRQRAARKLLCALTADAAAALQWESRIGTLTKSKAADFVVCQLPVDPGEDEVEEEVIMKGVIREVYLAGRSVVRRSSNQKGSKKSSGSEGHEN